MLCRADGHGYAHALMVAVPCRTLCPLMATPCRRWPAVSTAHGLMVAHALPVAGLMLCPVMDAPG